MHTYTNIYVIQAHTGKLFIAYNVQCVEANAIHLIKYVRASKHSKLHGCISLHILLNYTLAHHKIDFSNTYRHATT